MKIISLILMLVTLSACNENFNISVKNPTADQGPGTTTPPPGPTGPRPFITKFKTDATGFDTSQITIYLTPTFVYDFVVDWGDGSTSEIDAWDDPDTVHIYSTPGTYTVSMLGKIPRIFCNSGWGDGKKLIEISQWGTNKWESLLYAFAYSDVQITATDAPDLSLITDLEGLFQFSSVNGAIGHWNVSTITNMKKMFSATTNFNGNIAAWNTSNVTDMSEMFYNASAFNQNINSWDVRKVTDMSGMFAFASAFNQNLNSWRPIEVTNMNNMFSGATLFNGNITSWNTAKVTNMGGMFYNAPAFNQNINGWNVSAVTDMSYMFSYATAFNQDLNSWVTSEVTSMQQMFSWTTNFNGNIVDWNTSKVTNMNSMFYAAAAFNQDIHDWDVDQVTDDTDFDSFSNGAWIPGHKPTFPP